jgi:hypothetical protein
LYFFFFQEKEIRDEGEDRRRKMGVVEGERESKLCKMNFALTLISF